MNDHYYLGPTTEKDELISRDSDWLSGKDIFINYIGTQSLRLIVKAFDLRIWENGQDEVSGSYFVETVQPGTCTEAGYRVRVCARCSYTERVEDAAAPGHIWVEATCVTAKTCTVCGVTEGQPKGHSFGDWGILDPTGCEKEGVCIRVCDCGAEEREIVPALEHVYEKGSCSICGEKDPDWMLGDVDGNNTLDYVDALMILRYSIGLEELENPALGDWNGDNDVNYEDALGILRASIGL